MNLPGAIEREVRGHLRADSLSATRISGGCISPAAQIIAKGETFFLKWADSSAAGDMFAAEADGLAALSATGELRIPKVIAQGEQWLLLEWLQPCAAGPRDWRQLGERLARMHAPRGATFGWHRDNFIGSLPQWNTEVENWPKFWRDQRLLPQLERARHGGACTAADAKRFDELFTVLPELLAVGQQEGPSLLHGDLWSGNSHGTTAGIALIDPSVYRGHREVDLAMAALFGGFPGPFWSAYDAEWPLVRAGVEQRRAAYQLYYLLVHVNLFGAGYVGQTRQALMAALR